MVGFSASASMLTYKNGDYIGSLNKKSSGAQCFFIMALGLFSDMLTAYFEHPMALLKPRG